MAIIAAAGCLTTAAGTPGRAAPAIDMRTIDFVEQPGFDAGFDTWSPARREFGQTFIAHGTSLNWIGLWLPGPPILLGATVHEGGPGGRQVGPPAESGEPLSWFAGLGWAEGQVPLTPGDTYYLRIYSLDGTKWPIGMPGLGDVSTEGMAYFDGEPQPDSDLGINLVEGGRSLLVDTGHGGVNLGFIEAGPGSGNCVSAGQTFVATAADVIQATTIAGMGGGWGEFYYAFHEDGPGGRQLAPPRKVGMGSDWGSTATWLPGEITLELGKRYYFKYWRADGKPFYSYLSDNVYPGGTAYRDDNPMPDFDLSFSIEGEATPASICWSYNIRPTAIMPTEATIEWETGTPSISQVEYGEHDYDQTTLEDANLKMHHSVRLTGLRSGTGYIYRVICNTRVPGSQTLRSRECRFITSVEGKDEPARLHPTPPPPPTAAPANAMPLVNPSFEKGAAGWQQAGEAGAPTRGVNGYLPRTGRGMWGWYYQFGGRRGQRILDQTSTYDFVYQTIEVEPGRSYEFSGWILTGDFGSAWGRDSRVRLIVDTDGKGTYKDLEHLDDSNATQWFATKHQWLRARLRFKATGDHAVVGFHLWQWWSLEADYLFVDDAQVVPVDGADPERGTIPIVIEDFVTDTSGNWGNPDCETSHVASFAYDEPGSPPKAIVANSLAVSSTELPVPSGVRRVVRIPASQARVTRTLRLTAQRLSGPRAERTAGLPGDVAGAIDVAATLLGSDRRSVYRADHASLDDTRARGTGYLSLERG